MCYDFDRVVGVVNYEHRIDGILRIDDGFNSNRDHLSFPFLPIPSVLSGNLFL